MASIEAIFLEAAPGDAEVFRLVDRDASREAFEALAPRCRFLHLATHAWFAPESVPCTRDERELGEGRTYFSHFDQRERVTGLAPMVLCGLAFAGANGEPDELGRVFGVMTAEELASLDLESCELAVLSACETGVGRRRAGQGIASLQQALHAAGVRTAITSLWRVPDEVTRDLMTDFYRRIWKLGQPKARALWEAKQAIRQQLGPDGEPRYRLRDWAGWVLSGNPD